VYTAALSAVIRLNEDAAANLPVDAGRLVAAAEHDGSLILIANELVPKLWSASVSGDTKACCSLLDTSPGQSEQARLLNFPYPHPGGKPPLHGAAMHGGAASHV
jgi:hypothetical protein